MIKRRKNSSESNKMGFYVWMMFLLKQLSIGKLMLSDDDYAVRTNSNRGVFSGDTEQSQLCTTWDGEIALE